MGGGGDGGDRAGDRGRRRYRERSPSQSGSDQDRDRDVYYKRITDGKLLAYPKSGELPAWKAALKTACVESAIDMDEGAVVGWVAATEAQDTTFESLADSTAFTTAASAREKRDFGQLDRKLAGALKRILATCDAAKQLWRDISQKDQDVQARTNRILKGRQMLHMVLQSYRTNPKMGLVYGIQHFNDLRWIGDNDMERFKMNWFDVVHLQGNPLDDSHLAEILLNLMRESKVMQPDIAIYRKQVHTTGVNDYKVLISILDRHIAMYREAINTKKLRDSFAHNSGQGKPKNAAPAQSGKRQHGVQVLLHGWWLQTRRFLPFQTPFSHACRPSRTWWQGR